MLHFVHFFMLLILNNKTFKEIILTISDLKFKLSLVVTVMDL